MNHAMHRTLRQRWQLLAARIDALGQRERVMAFGGVLASLVFVANLAVLGPLQRKRELLRDRIAQQQNNIDGVNGEIVQKLEQAQADPDAPAHMRLAAVRGETERLSNELRAMQRGLVPPERIAPLLEAILRANGRLKLVSVRTLPVDPLSSLGDKKEQGAPPTVPAPAPAAKADELLFRHGVELTVRGSYLDMVDYMTALEALPTQLFWGKAQLEVEQYPSVRLTLTLYTLSLDEKWMKL
jgi:MSHA biogenesis protein MshJ